MKLPKEWIQSELSELAKINPETLGTITSRDFPFRYIDLSCVNEGRIDVPSGRITFAEAPSRARRIVAKNDILMSMVRPTLYGHALVPSSPADWIASTGFAVIRCTGIEPAFAFHCLFGHQITSQLQRLLVGSNYPAINSSDVEQLVFTLPKSVPEQRKIADILSTWDEALETLDALIAAKARRKQALMQQLLTGRKRVKGAAGTWKKVRMSEVLERVFRPIDWHPDLDLNLISLRRRCGGLFRRPEVKGSEYKTQDLHEIRSGDFLISKRQVVHGAWGLVTPAFEGGHVSKEYAILDNRAPDKLHMPFFAWLAQTRRLIRLARVSSTGVHIEKLIFDPDVFLRESIRLPADLAEQEKIATILDTADQELTLLRGRRETLDQQKRGLMQRLLTGKIRVSA